MFFLLLCRYGHSCFVGNLVASFVRVQQIFWYINRQAVPTRCYDNVSSIARFPVMSVLLERASWIDASLAKLCKVKVLLWVKAKRANVLQKVTFKVKLSVQSFNRFTINFTFRKKVSRLRLRTDSFTLWDKVLCLTMFIRFARETLITDRFALTERQLQENVFPLRSLANALHW